MPIVKAIQNIKEKLTYEIIGNEVFIKKGKEELHRGDCKEALCDLLTSLGIRTEK